jgi:hypothetical protein
MPPPIKTQACEHCGRALPARVACRIVGGHEKPISAATYYRGVKAGRLPAPENPTPGVSRIRRGELIAKLNASDQGAQ